MTGRRLLSLIPEWAQRVMVRVRDHRRDPGVPDGPRSVVFLHHSYYHFYYLAQALRRRGWDAVAVTLDAPDGPHAAYYHGEDINLYSPSDSEFRENIERFYAEALGRFRLLHFAGDGHLSFFPANWRSARPSDIVEWRRRGRKIAYSISGCNSGVAQSTVARWSALDGAVVCDRCVWQTRRDVCQDAKNLAWGRKVHRYCDLVFTEASPALDYQHGPKVIREPTTMCLDPTFWRPDLPVPERFRVTREPGELTVYHSFGNFESRTQDGRNIKGTPAITAAVERLKGEGVPVRLLFVTNMKNSDVRFLQAQADVIVDQLNYGRYGATAREAMMLGKPTICYINRQELASVGSLRSLDELPLVSANEQTIYSVLKGLLLDGRRRAELATLGRQYALKWHSADACAERYERIYDMLMAGEAIRYPYDAEAALDPRLASGTAMERS